MKKSKTLLSEKEKEVKEQKFINGIESIININGSLIYLFLYLAIFFSLIISIYYLAVSDLIGIAKVGFSLLKYLVFFLTTYLTFSLIWLCLKLNKINKEKFKERRNKLKEEITIEILKEIKNVRRITPKR